MGRNSGDKVFWTHIQNGTALYTMVCQKHAIFDSPSIGFLTTSNHLENQHGCTEQ